MALKGLDRREMKKKKNELPPINSRFIRSTTAIQSVRGSRSASTSASTSTSASSFTLRSQSHTPASSSSSNDVEKEEVQSINVSLHGLSLSQLTELIDFDFELAQIAAQCKGLPAEYRQLIRSLRVALRSDLSKEIDSEGDEGYCSEGQAEDATIERIAAAITSMDEQ